MRACVRSIGTALASSLQAMVLLQLPVRHAPWPEGAKWQPVRGLQLPIQACGTLTFADAPGSRARPLGPRSCTAPRDAGHTMKAHLFTSVNTRSRPWAGTGTGPAPALLVSEESAPVHEQGLCSAMRDCGLCS